MKVLGFIATLIFTSSAFASSVTGAGATFPAPVYSKWAEKYKAETNIQLNYQAIGSSGGIRQIKSKTVNFGATDDPLDPMQVDTLGLMQFPAVIGGVVIVVNVPGIAPGQVTINGSVAADIFRGTITKWNDEQIANINPDVKLPDLNITVVHRSDGSGTTAVFTDYLFKQSTSFAREVGKGATVKWGGTAVGGKGNAGVAAMVGQIKGSIGYVEYAYAKQNKLTHAAMINKSGKKVQPSAETFAAAAANANWSVPGMAVNLNDQKGDRVWPITAATFILVYDDKSDTSKNVVKFFDWAYSNGDKVALELDYVPLPQNVKQKIRKDWVSNGLK